MNDRKTKLAELSMSDDQPKSDKKRPYVTPLLQIETESEGGISAQAEVDGGGLAS